MCGRFTQHYTWEEVHAFLNVFGAPRNLQPRYNIAPTTLVDVVFSSEQWRELTQMRWGLVPGWWKKSLQDLPAAFNARAESVADKPMYRDAFRQRRCIIPASGFYEWTGEKGQKQPHLFTAADGSPILALPVSGTVGAIQGPTILSFPAPSSFALRAPGWRHITIGCR
jgi:putative SOS response-associated peptidase YedK